MHASLRTCLLLAILFNAASPAAERPNILFLIADDLGGGGLGVLGGGGVLGNGGGLGGAFPANTW